MKNLLTLFAALVLFLGVAYGQNSSTVTFPNGMVKHQLPANAKAKSLHHSNHHEKNGLGFWIDLDSADSFNSASIGVGYSRFTWDANMHYTIADTAGGHQGLKNAYYVMFDTLVDSYNASGPMPNARSSYPTVFVDSLWLWVGQENNSGIDDTLIISVIGVIHPSSGLGTYPDTAGVTVYSRDTIYICACAPLNPGNYTDGYFAIYSPNNGAGVNLPTNTFCVKVEYWGSKQDSFMFVSGCPSFSGAQNCAGYTMADTSSYRPNSFYKDVAHHMTYPTPLDSAQTQSINCNNNPTFTYGVDGADYIENNAIFAYISTSSSACNGFSASTTPTAATCGTCANGSVTSSYTGGHSPYSYLWSNSAVLQNIASLLPGVYTVTITDAMSCTAVSSATVINNACAGFSVTLNPTAALCSNCADGWVSCMVNGGASPFTFNWSNGETTQNATALLPGTYTVTAHDANSCTTTNTSTITNANVCSATFLLYPDTAAHTYWIVNQSTGNQPMHYSWDWGDASPHDTTAYPTHTYAAAGNYTICLAITDGIGCSTSYCNSYYLQRNANSMVTVYVIQTTGINEVSNTSFVSVLPNPNDGNFTLSYRIPASTAELRIMDISGRVLYNKPVTGIEGKETINANLHAGIYYWELISNETILNKGKMAVMK